MAVNEYTKEYRARDNKDLHRSRKTLAGQNDHPKVKKRIAAIDAVLKERGQEPEKETPKTEREDYTPQTFDEILAVKYTAKAKNAHQRGISFELTLSEMRNLMMRKTCYYTGMVMSDDCDPMAPQKRTLDRIDSEKGYTKGNTVACCFAANALKNAVLEDPQSICRLSVDHLKRFTKSVSELGQ
ncbi:HNH endonuclease [Salicola phage CGphi29]|uniref:HNH endonuclease n=1 Tax=Salicola phage CGphi29 TaxID=754067 RepID=UPI0002C0AF08|nr:HNH endonuclease [Salicola phage CGphi29]AGH31852.1 hypothetical protein SLPG_00058 [Salicola phage CGphi29]